MELNQGESYRTNLHLGGSKQIKVKLAKIYSSFETYYYNINNHEIKLMLFL